MPRGDGTGPDGKGPKTGRGLGKAVGNNMGSGIGQPKRIPGGNNPEMNLRNSKNKPGQKTGRGKNRNN
jgi:hypothetical protein